MRVEEERQPGRERVDGQPGRPRGVDVGDAVRERERHLLHGVAARFPDVIAADADRVPARHLGLTKGERVGAEAQRRPGRVDVRAARDVLLEDVVLDRAAEVAGAGALLLGDGLIQREQGRRGGVDRHRGRDLGEGDAVEQDAHVLERVDRHADPADLAARHRVIGVAAHLGRQVERDRQALAALGEQVLVAPVGLGGGAEAGVLPHRPQLAAVHGLLDAAGERELSGRARRRRRRVAGDVSALDLDVGVGREPGLAQLSGPVWISGHSRV